MDGFIILCDCSLAVEEYQKTGNVSKYLLRITELVAGYALSKFVGGYLERYATKLTPEIYEKINNCINESQGKIFGELANYIINFM